MNDLIVLFFLFLILLAIHFVFDIFVATFDGNLSFTLKEKEGEYFHIT